MDKYIEAVETEIGFHIRAGYLEMPLKTIFIGGGTPTSLGIERLAKLMGGVFGLIDAETEFSVEVNPGTVDVSTVDQLAASGVNRISTGVQSFDAMRLKQLGRIHGPDEAINTIELLRVGGIRNIGIDLIYALPDETTSQWLEDISRAISLGVQHISIYALSFEEGTPMSEDLAAGRIMELDDEIQREMYYRAADVLQANGYEHYEISSFALPDRRCRHNQVYWRNDHYIGVGPVAAGFMEGVRWTNIPDVVSYTNSLLKGNMPPVFSERLTGKKAIAETLMLALRCVEGVELEWFVRRYGKKPAELFPITMKRLLENNILVRTPTHLLIGRDYLFTSNTVYADFLSEAEAHSSDSIKT